MGKGVGSLPLPDYVKPDFYPEPTGTLDSDNVYSTMRFHNWIFTCQLNISIFMFFMFVMFGTIQVKGEPVTGFYDLMMKDIEGNAVPLSAYGGEVVLVVNVASVVGFTAEYGGLEALYEKEQVREVRVMVFPAKNCL